MLNIKSFPVILLHWVCLISWCMCVCAQTPPGSKAQCVWLVISCCKWMWAAVRQVWSFLLYFLFCSIIIFFYLFPSWSTWWWWQDTQISCSNLSSLIKNTGWVMSFPSHSSMRSPSPHTSSPSWGLFIFHQAMPRIPDDCIQMRKKLVIICRREPRRNDETVWINK